MLNDVLIVYISVALSYFLDQPAFEGAPMDIRSFFGVKQKPGGSVSKPDPPKVRFSPCLPQKPIILWNCIAFQKRAISSSDDESENQRSNVAVKKKQPAKKDTKVG